MSLLLRTIAWLLASSLHSYQLSSHLKPVLRFFSPSSADYIHRRLSEWSRQFEAAGLGGFFKPCAYLERCVRSGTKLSAGPPAASKM